MTKKYAKETSGSVSTTLIPPGTVGTGGRINPKIKGHRGYVGLIQSSTGKAKPKPPKLWKPVKNLITDLIVPLSMLIVIIICVIMLVQYICLLFNISF